MILKGAANFLLLLMQNESVAFILSNDDGDGDGDGERQRSNRCRLEKQQFARAVHSFVDFFAVTARLRCETA